MWKRSGASMCFLNFILRTEIWAEIVIWPLENLKMCLRLRFQDGIQKLPRKVFTWWVSRQARPDFSSCISLISAHWEGNRSNSWQESRSINDESTKWNVWLYSASLLRRSVNPSRRHASWSKTYKSFFLLPFRTSSSWRTRMTCLIPILPILPMPDSVKIST